MLLVLIWKFPDEGKGLHAATKVESVLFSTHAPPTALVVSSDHLRSSLITEDPVKSWLIGVKLSIVDFLGGLVLRKNCVSCYFRSNIIFLLMQNFTGTSQL